jgi:hypothetical protein
VAVSQFAKCESAATLLETTAPAGNYGWKLPFILQSGLSGNTSRPAHWTVTSTRREFPGANGKSASWSVETQNQKCTVPFPGAGVQVVWKRPFGAMSGIPIVLCTPGIPTTPIRSRNSC